MKILIAGMSHINCMARATVPIDLDSKVAFDFLQIRNFIIAPKDNSKKNSRFGRFDNELIAEQIQKKSKDKNLTVLCPNGNEHVIISLLKRDEEMELPLLCNKLELRLEAYTKWLDMLIEHIESPVVILPPPPPIQSEKHILEHPSVFRERLEVHGVAPAGIRLQVWKSQQNFIRRICEEKDLALLKLPEKIFSPDGFLGDDFIGNDPSHGNDRYGEILLRALFDYAENAVKKMPEKPEKPLSSSQVKQYERKHPYLKLPDYHFWKQAVAGVEVDGFDPVVDVPFTISTSDKVATAGSCFAQHISKRIKRSGFHFLVTESAVALSDGQTGGKKEFDFSARYGNIYTVRQLLQLFERSFGYFMPIEGYWQLPDGKFVDPLRPQIEPGGFPTIEALEADRAAHLAAVKTMFQEVDVFVFTLGLTECWVSRLDGTAYPLAPGVAGGEYDSQKYAFINFEVNEIIEDLKRFVDKLRLVNPGVRIILTVSPVPLVASYEKKHVLVSTTYSKSVLRVAADTISRQVPSVCYFPSYEIITGNYNRGKYFGDDLRSIRQEGVDHVMSVFMRHMTDGGEDSEQRSNVALIDDLDLEMEELAEAACDEELLEKE